MQDISKDEPTEGNLLQNKNNVFKKYDNTITITNTRKDWIDCSWCCMIENVEGTQTIICSGQTDIKV